MTDTATAEDVLRVAAGDVVAGKYRVERVLGQGAMGIVVAARHEELGQKVAIKLLHPDVGGSDDGLERFLREARAAAKLESDHVARVFDVGKFGEKNAYMVMEHLEGSDLEKYLDNHGALPIDEAVDYVLEALEALAHAHAHGMVHRDVKPSNLFLVERVDGTRRVKILDFGISKTEAGFGVSSPGSSTLTSPHAVLGSPAYMAPEQIRSSKNVDQRADIWSVGVMLYELVTGKSPFVGESIGDTLARVLASRPEPITQLRRDVPPLLVEAISRCLELDEAKRFQDVSELADALAAFGSPRTQDLPRRIRRVLSRATNVAPMRAVIPSDPHGHVNVAAETLAAPDMSSAKGTQITATSSRSASERTKSPRSSALIGALIFAVALSIGSFALYMNLYPKQRERIDATASGIEHDLIDAVSGGAPSASSVVDRPSVEPRAGATQGVAPVVSAISTVTNPQVVPIVETSARSLPASSAVGTNPTTNGTTVKPLPTSTTKKTTPAPTSTIPSGLLDGRD